MKLRLIGHDYKYSVEQIMLALFPEQRPEYVTDNQTRSDNDEEIHLDSRLSFNSVYAQAVSIIHINGKSSRGIARVKREKLTSKLVSDRLLQRILKQSFYRAAESFLDAPPVWGSLTGIRPAQIAAMAIKSGKKADLMKKTLAREYYVSPERAEMCVQAAQAAIKLERTLEPRDIALYVGIPFCPTRCAYCSFVSNSVERSFELIEPFTDVLLQEINETADIVNELGLRVITVYIGGGTPTSIPDEALESVLSRLKEAFDLSHLREYTVEAGRPDTITEQKLEIISRLGADRICINPQSMSGKVLSAIGRKHTPEDVPKAVSLIKRTGASLNMDIIAGLPEDTPDGFQKTLDTVLELAPPNVTIHTLSLKKGSRIMLENTSIPSGTDVAVMLEYASGKLHESGYKPYYLYRQKYTSGGFENTGWCLPGNEGIYNICMMEELCTVVAMGGGGVTKLVSPDGRIERIFNAKYPREYIMQVAKRENKLKKVTEFYVGRGGF
jgi:oxygen-independent coproporphyrinogen-3 oxidase